MYTTTTNNTMLFCDYYKQWITVYKEGAIRPVTMSKYNMAHQWLEKLIPIPSFLSFPQPFHSEYPYPYDIKHIASMPRLRCNIPSTQTLKLI